MTYVLRLSFPIIPKSLNVKLRSHRFQNDREMKSWAGLIALETLHKRPPAPLEYAKIRLVRYSHRMLDFDGLVGSMKPIVDALVEAGIICDDSWAVTGPWEVDQVFRPQVKGPLLEILVEDYTWKRGGKSED